MQPTGPKTNNGHTQDHRPDSPSINCATIIMYLGVKLAKVISRTIREWARRLYKGANSQRDAGDGKENSSPSGKEGSLPSVRIVTASSVVPDGLRPKQEATGPPEKKVARRSQAITSYNRNLLEDKLNRLAVTIDLLVTMIGTQQERHKDGIDIAEEVSLSGITSLEEYWTTDVDAKDEWLKELRELEAKLKALQDSTKAQIRAAGKVKALDNVEAEALIQQLTNACANAELIMYGETFCKKNLKVRFYNRELKRNVKPLNERSLAQAYSLNQRLEN